MPGIGMALTDVAAVGPGRDRSTPATEGNPELHPDPGMDNGADWTRAIGTGFWAVSGGIMSFIGVAGNLIGMSPAPGAALQALLAPATLYDVEVELSSFSTSTGLESVSLKNGTGALLNFTGPGVYAVQVTSGVSGTAFNAFRPNNMAGTFGISRVSVKLH